MDRHQLLLPIVPVPLVNRLNIKRNPVMGELRVKIIYRRVVLENILLQHPLLHAIVSVVHVPLHNIKVQTILLARLVYGGPPVLLENM